MKQIVTISFDFYHCRYNQSYLSNNLTPMTI